MKTPPYRQEGSQQGEENGTHRESLTLL
jgi:hypothetical protein